MKKLNQIFYILCGFAILFSCNSNSLKQDQAEKTIREFLNTNSFETSKEVISPQTIQKIEETNIFSQFNTSVKVHFNNNESAQGLILSFIFTRTPDNKWFLQSIETQGSTSQELSEWLKTKKHLNIAVQ